MSILNRFGFFSDELLTRPGAKKALVETIRSTSTESVGSVEGALPFDYYNRHKATEGFVPTPLIPGTADMSVFLRVASLGSPSDLSVILTIVTLPLKNLSAYIVGYASATYDMSALLRSWYSVNTNFYAYVTGSTSSSTQPHVYDYTILSTPGGVSILRRFLTTRPDLNATLAGWDYKDLGATLNVISAATSDLYALVGSVVLTASELVAILSPTHIENFPGSITSIPPSGLLAQLRAIPGYDLPAYLQSVPGVNLVAFAGGHYPVDLRASLIPSPPKDIIVMIRAGLSGISSLNASITAGGAYIQLPAFIRGFFDSSKKLKASITARVPVDIIAFIHGRVQSDLTAYIKGVNELNMLCRMVAWAREVPTDMVGFVRAGFAGIKTIPVYIHGVISTHTSNKPVSFHKLTRPFNRFLVGTRGGLSFVTLEPVWGNFPDLSASVTGKPFSVFDMRAFIRTAVRSSVNLGASITSVTKSITINKIPINYVNLSELTVYISAFSGYNPMSASVSGWRSASTSTATGSGWVYVSSTIKFYLGTSKGLFIPSNITRAIRPDRFLNQNLTPDLWGYARGWDKKDMLASIAVQLYGTLPASIVAQDLSHVSIFTAYIGVMHVRSLSAQILATGGYSGMSATLIPCGLVSDMVASIRPYLEVLGYRMIAVETKPLYDLRAVLNPIAYCGYASTYSTLNVFIRGTVRPPGGLGLTAHLNALSNVDDLTAEIVGRKITRIKLINFMFRAQIRSSASMGAVIVGNAWSTSDMVACIVPLHHTRDISATITPVFPQTTYRKHDPVETIDVYKMVNQNAELHKQVSMAFDTKVESYIYDSIQKSLYTIGDDKWVLNFSELSETGTFFDKNTADKTYLLDNIAEYNSIDEAIRAAIVWLTEPQRYDLSASITAVGGYSDMRAVLEGLHADRVKDLISSVYIVTNQPTMAAYISAFSGYGAMNAYVNGFGMSSPGLSASVSGVVYTGLFAGINGVI